MIVAIALTVLFAIYFVLTAEVKNDESAELRFKE